MKQSLLLGGSLLGVWLLWSGHYTPLLISFGVGSSVMVVLLSRRMEIVDEEGQPFELVPRLISYLPWLVWEIIRANIDVTRRILHPKLPISPTLVEVKASQKTELGQVIYANSITLTPGTISIRIRDGVILVHALSKQGADALLEGEMDRRVSAVEGKS